MDYGVVRICLLVGLIIGLSVKAGYLNLSFFGGFIGYGKDIISH
jgi:hypothetical protein